MPENAPDSDLQTISGEFSLAFGATSLTAGVRVPAGRTTLTELLPIIRNLENAIVDKMGEEANAAGKTISCRAGCGACCRQMVPLSLFEAERRTVLDAVVESSLGGHHWTPRERSSFYLPAPNLTTPQTLSIHRFSCSRPG